VSDLPPGWTQSADDSTSSGGNICDLQRTPSNLPGATVSFEQGQFGPFLSEAIGKYPTVAEATAWMQTAKTKLPCGDWTSLDDQGTPQVWHTTTLPFPALGDDSTAARLSADVPLLGSIQVDIVLVRVGAYSMVLGNFSLGTIDSSLTETMARKAVDKLKANQ
jgi:hypothetical protein